MHTKLPTLKDRLSLELVSLPPRKKFRTTLDHWLLIQKRMKSEPIQMKLRVEEEKSLMQ
jgi:hypothetical protein